MPGKTKTVTYNINSQRCFICTSHKPSSHGHPMIMHNYKACPLHRWLYELAYGILDKDIDVHHECENKMCINIQHLKVKHHRIHASEHGRGELCGTHLLKEYQVKEIRADEIHTQAWLAQYHNVAQSTISLIKNKKSWKHLEG